MERDKVPHAGLASDTEFLRRVTLDLTGRIPEPGAIRSFVADKDPDKRKKLIDSLMATSVTGLRRRPVLGNWEWSNILGLYGGQPVAVTLGFDNASIGAAGGQRPNLVGNPVLSDRTRLRWFNTAAFARPSQFTFGNAGRNLLRGPALKNYDTAIMKNFVLHELKALQFRAEMFNALNIVNFGQPVANFSSQDFGVILSARASRSIQMSLKFSF